MVRLWVQERLNRLRLFILKRSCRSSPVPLGWPWRRKAPFDDDGGRPSTGDGRRCRFATNAAEGSTLDAHGCTADDHTGMPQGYTSIGKVVMGLATATRLQENATDQAMQRRD